MRMKNENSKQNVTRNLFFQIFFVFFCLVCAAEFKFCLKASTRHRAVVLCRVLCRAEELCCKIK